MTKTELIKQVADKTNTDPKLAKKLIDAVFDTIVQAMCNGEKLQLVD